MSDNFGTLLRNKREAKGFTQVMLAKHLGMNAVQLCRIEKGNSSPTLKTIAKIASALGVSVLDLLSSKDTSRLDVEFESTANVAAERFYAVRYNADSYSVDSKVLEEILPVENGLLELENSLCIAHSTCLPFVHSFNVDKYGARTTARYVRSACAVGSASFSDLAELLEFRNVRFHVVRLPDGEWSRSFFDGGNHSLSIVLSEENTVERNIYRIAYELGWMILSGAKGYKPVRESEKCHRFAREFAAEFLMPEESVRFAVSRLGVRPTDWTLEMVCYLKAKFNVSAEAFALRLEALKLISERLRQHIREELRAYYDAHPDAMEPEPRLVALNIGMRRKLLEMEVARREMKR